MTNATILIVDDNEDNLDLIEDALSEEGFRIICARSGPDAMSLLLSREINLVLLDIMMPDMNGFAVLEMIRFIPRLMNTAVIIQTAHGDRHNVERAKELRVKAVLTKPVSPAAILAAVGECVGLEHPSEAVSGSP